MTTSSSALVAGTFTKYVLLAASIATGIFLMPFTVQHLGQTQYGLWMLIASLTYYLQLLDMGYGNGIVRHLVDADRRNGIDEMNQIASTFACVYAAIGVLSCIVALAMIAWVVPRFPHLDPAQVRVAQVLFAILAFRVAVAFPMTIFGAVTNARQGFVVNNTIALVTVLLNAVLTYAILRGGHGVVTLVAVTSAVSVAAYAGYAWSAYRAFPELRIHPSYFSRARWREVTTFSVYLFVIQIAGQISFNIDTVVVGAYIGTAAVAVYSVALRLADYQRRVCDQFSGMLFPVAVGFGADGDITALRQTLIDGMRIGTLLVIGVTVCLVGFSGPLITRWMGSEFAASVAPFVALAAAGVVIVSQAATGNVLIATGRHRALAWCWLGEAAANLCLSVALVSRFGVAGVALGTVLPLVVGHVFFMLPVACRAVNVSVPRCLLLTTRPALTGGIIAALVCASLRRYWPPDTLHMVALEASITASVYAVAAIAIGLGHDTRTRYAAQLRAGVSFICRA